MMVTACGSGCRVVRLADVRARGAGSTRSPHKAPICASGRHAGDHNRDRAGRSIRAAGRGWQAYTVAYRLLADATMVVHAGFLVYLVVGGFLAWRWRWAIWPHVAAAAYGLGIVTVGWDCPLTHVENWARARAGLEMLPSSGFIDHYLTGVFPLKWPLQLSGEFVYVSES